MVVAKLKMMSERTKTFCPERGGASFLVFCKEAEAEAVRDDENEGLQKQRVFEPLTAEDAQD